MCCLRSKCIESTRVSVIGTDEKNNKVSVIRTDAENIISVVRTDEIIRDFGLYVSTVY